MRPIPSTRKTPMHTKKPKPIIMIEDFGNGIFIQWKIFL